MAMAFGVTKALPPVKIETGGIHPLVKKSMLPRLKQAKASGVAAQSSMMRGIARSGAMKPTSGGGNLMSMVERRSRRGMVGRSVPLSGKPMKG